jgi:hypothetical protein
MPARNLVLLSLSAFFGIPICAYAVDTLPSIEDVALRSAVVEKCHATQTDDDKAYVDVAVASMQAEAQRIWSQLSRVDPLNVDNAGKAGQMLHQRFSRLLEDARIKIKNQDCAELERQTQSAGR